MRRITANLWFDGNAEEAAEFYVDLFPDSRLDNVIRSPATNPPLEKGDVVVVEFTLAGHPFAAINGGPKFQFNEAVSFDIACEDQAEIDRYWEALTADGGSESRCGWCRDRFGLWWQVTPIGLNEMIAAPDREAAERATQAMLGMGKLELARLEHAFRNGQLR